MRHVQQYIHFFFDATTRASFPQRSFFEPTQCRMCVNFRQSVNVRNSFRCWSSGSKDNTTRTNFSTLASCWKYSIDRHRRTHTFTVYVALFGSKFVAKCEIVNAGDFCIYPRHQPENLGKCIAKNLRETHVIFAFTLFRSHNVFARICSLFFCALALSYLHEDLNELIVVHRWVDIITFSKQLVAHILAQKTVVCPLWRQHSQLPQRVYILHQ